MSSTVYDADQRLAVEASATISQMSLDDECQFHEIWKCLVVLYHIIFQIEGISIHFKEELTPWRRVHTLYNTGMRLSVEGKQKIEDPSVRNVRKVAKCYSRSEKKLFRVRLGKYDEDL